MLPALDLSKKYATAKREEYSTFFSPAITSSLVCFKKVPLNPNLGCWLTLIFFRKNGERVPNTQKQYSIQFFLHIVKKV